MDDRLPYTYLIGWSSHNMWYYGVRYASKCHPSDLWKTYFTSSEYVKEFRIKYGEPDVISIRKVFDSANKARLHEHKVLTRLNAATRSDFLNRSRVIGIDPNKHHMKTEYYRKKYSKMFSGKNNPNYGKKQSDESNSKRSKALLGRENKINGKTLEEQYGIEKALQIKNKLSQKLSKDNNPMFGKKHSKESKEKISQNKKGKCCDGNNANAKPIAINGIEYSCIKEAEKVLNISRYKILKLLKKQNESR